MLKSRLLSEKIIDHQTIQKYENEINEEFEEAINFAKSSPFPDKAEMYLNVFPN